MSNWTSNFGIEQLSSFSYCTNCIFCEDFPCLNVSRIPLAAQKQSPTTPFLVWPQFLHHSSRHVAFDIPSLFFGVSFLFLIWLLFLIYPDWCDSCEFSWMCLNSCLFFWWFIVHSVHWGSKILLYSGSWPWDFAWLKASCLATPL